MAECGTCTASECCGVCSVPTTAKQKTFGTYDEAATWALSQGIFHSPSCSIGYDPDTHEYVVWYK
jgi:hypothetical protein